MATGGTDDGAGGSGARGCMNLPSVGILRRVKVPKAPRRLGGEEVFTSSGRVGSAEGAVGGTAGVDTEGWADISGK
jgi:hypothetical protein